MSVVNRELARSIFIIPLLYLLTTGVSAGGFGFEILGLNVHVVDSAVQWGGRSARKLDASGRFVSLPGWEAYYEWEAGKDKIFNANGYRFTIANYLDTMDRRSGYIHLGLRWNFPFDADRTLSLGFGPSVFFRETWRVFPDYKKHQLLLESDNFLPGYEYLWFAFGDIDYQMKISKNLKLVLSVLPVIPYSILFSTGIFWEIN